MCKQRSQVRRVVEKKDSGAVHSGQPGRMHIKKNKIKTRRYGAYTSASWLWN